jgi:hypothetical protein
MLRRSLRFVAALVTFTAVLFVTSQETAVAAPLATGTAVCPVAGGAGTVSPGLSAAGHVGGVKINFQAKLRTSTGGTCGGAVITPAGRHVIGGSLVGTGYYNAPSALAHGSSCANFRGPDKVGNIKVTISWTTVGGPIAPTVITYTNNVATVTGPVNGYDTITLKAPTAVKAGSFTAGAPRTTKLVTTLPAPGLHCVGSTTAFKITGGGVSV